MPAEGTYWVAIAGILGTLGGVLIGGFVTWKIQERQIKHADATRFQERRLDIYTQFLNLSTTLLTHRSINKQDPDLIRKYLDIYQKVRLVASDKVMLIAHDYQNLLDEFLHMEDGAKIPKEKLTEFDRINADFALAARNELGISKM